MDEKVIAKEVPIPLVRSNQLLLVVGTIASLILLNKIIVVVLFIIAISSLLFGPKANLAFQIAKPILAHRLFYAPTESIELQRFNQLIACCSLGLALLFFGLGIDFIGWSFTIFITLAASSAIGGHCIGCKIYFPYKMWVNRNRMKYPFLKNIFHFIAGTGPFEPPFQLRVQPLMIMILAHESIRAGVNEIESYLKNEREIDLIDLKTKIDNLNRFITLHANQEDKRMYPFIDKKSKGIATQFEEEHREIEQLEIEIENALKLGMNGQKDTGEIIKIVLKWCDFTHKHLRSEEAVLMPKIPGILSYKESTDALLNILDFNHDEYLNFHLKYTFEGLNPGQRYNYVNVLKTCCSEEKFTLYEKILIPLVPEGSWSAFSNEETLI